jgi:type II secretory pathway pseudopilin PulG
MIVVLIMSILATLGISAFRHKMREAYKTEALAGLQAIGAAQESHRAETGVYLNVSANLSSYYPNSVSGVKYQFWGHAGSADWERLDPQIPQMVSYSYATMAGLPYSSPPMPDVNVDGLVWPVANTIREPWYVVAARGDIDGDGTYAYFLSTNLSSQVHIQNAFE